MTDALRALPRALRRWVRPFVPDSIAEHALGARQPDPLVVPNRTSVPAFCHVAHYDPCTDMNGAKMRLVEIGARLQSLGIDVFHVRTTDYSVYKFSDGAFARAGIKASDLSGLDILGVIFAWAWIFDHRHTILDVMGFRSSRPIVIYDSIDFLPLRMQREYEATLMQQRTVNLSLDGELSRIRDADITLAVTEEERVQFEMLGARATLVLGYAPREARTRKHEGGRVAGFFGSHNSANLYSVLRSATLAKMSGRFTQFIVAGSVCNYRDEIEEFRRIYGPDWFCTLGVVDTVGSYYDLIDVSVHVLAFGSGIKIKNVESLSFGVPLITNLVGAEGINVEGGAGMWVVETLSEFERATDEALEMRSACHSTSVRLADEFDAQVRGLAERAGWSGLQL